MDIIIHEEVKEKIRSGYYKRQKVSPRKFSEKDCAARETEREKLKQISDARKDNLNIKQFSNRLTNKLVIEFSYKKF